ASRRQAGRAAPQREGGFIIMNTTVKKAKGMIARALGVADEAQKLAASARASQQDLADSIATIRTHIGKVERAISEVERAPRPIEEALEAFEKHLDARGARFRKHWKGLGPIEAFRRPEGAADWPDPARHPDAFTDLLCLLLKDVI